MRWRALTGMLVALCLSGCGPSGVPTVEWTSSDGAISLSMTTDTEHEDGSSVVSDQGEGVLSAIRLSRTDNSRDAVFCVIVRTFIEDTDAYIDQSIARLADLEKATGGGVTHTLRPRRTVDDIPVLDFEEHIRGPRNDGMGDMFQFRRTFALAVSGKPYAYSISCNVGPHLSKETRGEIDAFVNSLKINRR